jgi:hypothetical protein
MLIMPCEMPTDRVEVIRMDFFEWTNVLYC